jgi:MFS family permease
MSGALHTVRAVFRLPSLRRLVPAFLAFSVTEWASWIALVVYAYSRGGPAEAGVVACVVFLPSILVAPAASWFGDRRPRARVLTGAYAVLSLSMAVTAVALIAAPPIVGYAMATLAATSITLVRPAHAALLPEVVRTPDELAVANAASGTAEGLGALIGPLLAGLLIGLAGPAAVYGAIALLTLGSMLVVLPLALAARPLITPTAVPRHGLLRELGAGLRTVLGDRRLFAVMAILSGAIALLGAFNVLLTVIAIDLLGGDDSTIGYVAAIAGLGSVLGAGATSLLMGRERLATVYVLAGALFAGAVALIGLNPGPVAILACVVAAGVGWAFVYVEALTLAQRLAGDDVMSRVFGIMEATMMASQAIGALAVAILIASVGMTSAIVVSGLGFGVVVALAAPTLIRADRLVPSRVRQLQALRAVPMFGPLSAPVLERLATGATTISVDPGRPIITAGEIGDRFYVILAGEVDVTTAAGDHRREGPGDSFGEIALLRDIPRTATVTSVAPTELLAVDRGPFLEALTGQPRSRALADTESARLLDADADTDARIVTAGGGPAGR